ncbi:hypothetical protein CWI75_14390 [Kineobactrum sediminis]|uniref:Sulfotransferase family protein n=1 Tax=Kineobactrum sediminis TaxID=1905677 RepID=A0A2N5XZU9_9GAMM|nr:hypothetical protein [Kineobactrum sediminis]PLW81653.1 hypothetical protein CWI75_14390 [Kineobactrum sediminis]
MALPDQHDLLFIVGMHRSGTSALCAALQACGASFGDNLLAPMAGVNEEGFWEDAEVVALNEALLASVGSSWYAPGEKAVSGDWPVAAIERFAEQAAVVLQRGFGDGGVQVVKDPRFCLTLPLWLDVCATHGITPRVCTAFRPPLEVAQSLSRRDGFPLGYGLRLDLAYRQALASGLPSAELQVSYADLATAPVPVMQRLAESVPLVINHAALATAVRNDLRHHDSAGDTRGLLATAVIAPESLPDLEAEIETQYSSTTLLSELAVVFVARGSKLTELGEAHSGALAIIAERDAQIVEFDRRLLEAGAAHDLALETIALRDGQIMEFDRRLAAIGSEHSEALEVIARRDREIIEFDHRLTDIVARKDAQITQLEQHLEDIYKLPLIGPILRRLRSIHAQR